MTKRGVELDSFTSGSTSYICVDLATGYGLSIHEDLKEAEASRDHWKTQGFEAVLIED